MKDPTNWVASPWHGTSGFGIVYEQYYFDIKMTKNALIAISECCHLLAFSCAERDWDDDNNLLRTYCSKCGRDFPPNLERRSDVFDLDKDDNPRLWIAQWLGVEESDIEIEVHTLNFAT